MKSAKNAPRREQAHWKTTQSRAKIRKKTKLGTLVLLFLVFILILGPVVGFTQSLFKPITSANESKSYLWDGDLSINLVLISSGVSVLNFDPDEKLVKVVNIPPDIYLEVPGGHGSWPLRSIYGLGQGENGRGLLKNSIRQFLAIPIDGYIEYGREEENLKLVEHLQQNPVALPSLISKLKTDLSPIELIRLSIALRGVRFDKIKSLDLAEGLLSQTTLGDGRVVLVGDPIKIDGFVTDNFSDSQIKAEDATVAIFNGTTHPGLAQKVAQISSHIGINVIITTSLDNQSVKKTYITTLSNKFPKTAKRLNQIFAADCYNNKNCDILEDRLLSERAEINIVIGEDFAQSLK